MVSLNDPSRKLILFIFVLGFEYISCKKGYNYCKFNCKDINTKKPAKHAACDSKCQLAKTTVDEFLPDFTFRKRILLAHNILRNQLAEGANMSGGNSMASDMMILNYDMSLEFTVMCWLFKRGDMEHDPCRGTEKFGSSVGQNLYLGANINTQTENGPRDIVKEWYNQLEYGNGYLINSYSDNKAFQGSNYFTQLVWSRTTHVGCARCHIMKNGKKQTLLGCNYGPKGNVPNQPVYKRGRGGTECMRGHMRNAQYAHLCGKSEPWSEEAKRIGNPELTLIRAGDGAVCWTLHEAVILLVFGVVLNIFQG